VAHRRPQMLGEDTDAVRDSVAGTRA
jgi:hypothetical protein